MFITSFFVCHQSNSVLWLILLFVLLLTYLNIQYLLRFCCSQTLQTDGASSFSTPVATGSVPSNTTQSRNAILVSHRQVRRLKPP